MQRECTDAPIAGVAGAIFQKESALLVKRVNVPFREQWSLPGGAVELGETLEDA